MLMKILAPRTKSNTLLIGVHRIFHSFLSPLDPRWTSGRMK
jgi:hypothetical protein